MTDTLNEQTVRARIASFRAPPDQTPIPESMIDSVAVRGGLIHVALAVPRAEAAARETLRRGLEAHLAAMPGATNAAVVLTAARAASQGGGQPQGGQNAGQQAPPSLLSQVGSVIAVASGKGGVGKSTVAVNLAAALAASGRSVGLLDADIYGPSLPRMLGTREKPQMANDKLLPLDAWGLKAISIGHVVSEETAMVWRGPMVLNALTQLMTQVAWPELDVMVIDLPPGTGDIQLTLAQRVRLTGAVVVSTPQDVALADVRRGVTMFSQVRVPVLGVVENMSYFTCPHCGERTEIFGHGGARREAERLGGPSLGELPLLPAIRETSDAGAPIVTSNPGSEAAKAFRRIADSVASGLGQGTKKSGPRIVVE